jgi:hydrogenase expression/formation protein HypC
MCLAIPGRVTAVYETNGLRMGKMDFGGVLKEVCLAYLPDLSVGNYAIVHVGFAISKVDEEVALETLRNFRELGLPNEEFM